MKSKNFADTQKTTILVVSPPRKLGLTTSYTTQTPRLINTFHIGWKYLDMSQTTWIVPYIYGEPIRIDFTHISQNKVGRTNRNEIGYNLCNEYAGEAGSKLLYQSAIRKEKTSTE